MKFTPEVVAALAVLRNAAENDFERHRLDVLERDLTNPPKVETIDERHQRFNGVTYCRSSTGHYKTNFSIHRAVWSYNYGEPPNNNYEVHHIDKNKANNNISNLQLLTKTEHHKLHKKDKVEKICPVCKKKFYVIPSQRGQIYCSRKCVATIPRQSKQTKKIEKVCPVCNKTFFVLPSYISQVHCSRECAHQTIGEKQKHVPRTKQPHLNKICPVCNKKFSVPQSQAHVVCCSQSCAKKLDWRNKQKLTRVCEFCKKEFIVHDKAKNKKYCSLKCYQESRKKRL